MANKYWTPQNAGNHLPFDSQIIDKIYVEEICTSKFSIRRIMMLEFSQFLENYLWPNYVAETASRPHTMSIVVMVNEKFRERVQVWDAFKKQPEEFSGFIDNVLKACLEDSIMEYDLAEQTALIVFLNHCFNSMEVDLVRQKFQRLVSITTWISLQEERRKLEFKKNRDWKKKFMGILKRDPPELKEKLDWERKFLHRIMVKFMTILESIPIKGRLIIS